MKKALSLLLALALCLCLTCTALAEVTFTSIATMSDGRFIYDSSLIRVQQNDGYHVLRIDGTDVTGEAYSSNFTYAYGYVCAALANGGLNSSGVFDEQGNLLVPYQYGVVDILSKDWVVAIKISETSSTDYDYTASSDNTKHFVIDSVDIYNLTKGACVGTLARDGYKDADDVYNVINIEDRKGVITSYDADFNALGTVKYSFDDDYATPEYTTYRENGRYGIKDAAGNIVMEPSYSSIDAFYGDYATVYNGEKYGLINTKGELVLPTQFDRIRRNYYGPYDKKTGSDSYEAAGYFCVLSDGKVGFANMDGEVTCEPRYSEKIMDLYGASALYTDMENNRHLLAADGNDVVVDYKSILGLEGASGMLFKVYDGNGYGVIDWHGELVFPCEYDSINMSGDGAYLLVRKDYKSSYELFSVDYGLGTAATAQTAAAAQGAANARSAISSLTSGTQEQQAPAVEVPVQTTSGLTDAKVIVGSVITLLEADAAANKLTITMLLDDVLVLTDNASVQTIVTSVKTLIEADAAANAASAVTLLRSVETLL